MKDELNYELLADVAQVIMGQSPPSSTYNTVGEGLPFYQGKTDFGDMYPTPRVYCTEPSRIAEAGDILISVRAPVGPTNVSQERSCIGRGISAIRVGKNLDRDFLLYFLRFYEPELAQAGTGSTFSAIAREDLETIKISLPSLTEQKRIASLLARADRLRQLRRTAHDLGDALLQSVFLEMFGDVAINSKNWEKIELGDALDVITYGLTVRPEYIEKGIPLISAREIRSGIVEFGNAPRISEKDFSETYDKGKPQKGDILFSKTGTIGSCAEVTTDETIAITQNVARLRFKEKYSNSAFAIQYLRMPYFQEMAKDAAKGNAVQDLQLGVMQQFPFYLPPLSLQEEFAGVVARVESLRGRMGESTRGVEGLFESLLSESFGG